MDFLNSVDTRIDKETLFKIGEQIFKLPEKTTIIIGKQIDCLMKD